MLTQVTCPACGGGWHDADVSCPTCGFVNPASPASEELIVSWVVTSTPPESPSAAQDTVCVACGYEGPMVPSPDGERGLCPACGDPWQDRGGIIRKSACPDCGQLLQLTEEHRGTTIICPKCRSLLGCLIDRRGRKWAGRSTILDIMALAAAFALGYMSALAVWGQHVPRPILNGVSLVALPITWTLVALRFIGPRPPRRRRFDPPGLAACLAVSAASVLNFLCAWDTSVITPPVPQPGRSGWFPTQTPHRSVLARLTHTAPRFKLRRHRYPLSFRGHVHGFRCTRRVSLQRSFETASPSLRGVLRSSSPTSSLLWDAPTPGRSSRRVSLPSLGDTTLAPDSLPPAGTRGRGHGEIGIPVPEPEMSVETAGSLRFPSDPRVPAPCSWTPVGPNGAKPSRRSRGPRLCQQRWLPRAKISGLDRTAWGLAVYASQWRSPVTTQDSLPAAG